MKKRGLIGRVVSTALVTAMVMTMGGMSAFAAETEPVIEITKTLNKPSNVVVPNTTFEFNIEYLGEQTGTKLTEAEKELAKTAVKFENNDNSIVASTSNALADTSYTFEEKVKFDITEENYSKPGVYRYAITEVTGDYEGMNYDSTTKYLDVMVTVVDNSLSIKYFFVKDVLNEETNEVKTEKSDGTFVNGYGANPDPDGKLANLIVKKEITGNQATYTDKFPFVISIDGNEENEEFGYVVWRGGAADEVRRTENGMIRIELGHQDRVEVYGLSENDTYTVVENAYEYDATYSVNGAEIDEIYTDTSDDELKGVRGQLEKDKEGVLLNDIVEFENNKTASTPTGIILSFAPYILMVALAGVFAFLFLRKKRDEF